VKHGGKYALSHEVANHEVAVGGAEILAEAASALPKSPIVIHQLGLAAKKSREDDSSAVKTILRSQLELLASGKRLIILQARRGPVVWNDAEESLTFLLGRVASRIRSIVTAGVTAGSNSGLAWIVCRRFLRQRHRSGKGKTHSSEQKAMIHSIPPKDGGPGGNFFPNRPPHHSKRTYEFDDRSCLGVAGFLLLVFTAVRLIIADEIK